MESYRILDREEASIEDIDTAMKLGAGMPMGPLELSDVSAFFSCTWLYNNPQNFV